MIDSVCVCVCVLTFVLDKTNENIFNSQPYLTFVNHLIVQQTITINVTKNIFYPNKNWKEKGKIIGETTNLQISTSSLN